MNTFEMAQQENARAREKWDKTCVKWNIPDRVFRARDVPRIMASLQDGYGVEDMAAMGVCTAKEARQVVAWMRKNGSLQEFYGV